MQLETIEPLKPTFATLNTVAPETDEQLNLLDTPFDWWPIRKSVTDPTCGCCGHIECVND